MYIEYFYHVFPIRVALANLRMLFNIYKEDNHLVPNVCSNDAFSSPQYLHVELDMVTILNKCSVYPAGYYLKNDSNIFYYNYSTKVKTVSMPFIFRSVFVSHYLYFVQYALLNICPHSLPQIRTGPEIHTSPTQRIHLVFPFNFLQATAIGHSI